MKVSKNQLTGALFILFGILGAFWASRIAVKTNLATAGDVGPRCFPYMACAGIILCGVGIIATCRDDSATSFLSGEELQKACRLIAVLVIYLIAVKYIGFLISTPFVLFVLIHMLKGTNKTALPVSIIFSAAFPCIIYYIFVNLLKIMLPKGVLF